MHVGFSPPGELVSIRQVRQSRPVRSHARVYRNGRIVDRSSNGFVGLCGVGHLCPDHRGRRQKHQQREGRRLPAPPGRGPVRPSLPRREAAWRRRHGRRVSGVGRRAQHGCRAEGHQALICRRRRERHRAAVQARTGPGASGYSQERHSHPRPRRGRGHQVHLDALCRGRRPVTGPSRSGAAPGNRSASYREAHCLGPERRP